MLPSLATAFLLGLLLGSRVPFFPLSIVVGLTAAAVALATLERRARIETRFAHWLYGALLAGVFYWSLFVFFAGQGQVFSARDADAEITGRVVAPVQHAPGRVTLIVRREPVQTGEARRLRLVWRAPDIPVFHGDRIALRAKLRPPSGSLNPGGFDYGAYLERQGIDAVGSVTGPGALRVIESGQGKAQWALWNRIDRWRGDIRQAALQTLTQPGLGLYLGIIIGDRGYLDEELRDQFMVTGTVHLLSISGSHLGLIALLAFFIFKRLALAVPSPWLLILSRAVTPTRLAAAFTVAPVLLYALLAGAEVATLRSLIMILVALLALWLGHERQVLHALAAAALLIVLHDPHALFDISFQLSFLSVLAIALFLQRQTASEPALTASGVMGWCMHWGRGAVRLSGAVTLATVPLVALYFNQVPWMGIVTNLVAVPVTGFVIVPVGLLSALWHIVVGGMELPAGLLNQGLCTSMAEAVRVLSLVPASEWHVAAPSVPIIVLYYVACVRALAVEGPKADRVAAGVAVSLILMWWIWSPRLVDGDRFRVTFLDVGQGDSAVLELPDGQVVLIDGGGAYERFDMGRGVVGPYLWNRGIRALDHVVGTHPQLDHVGGLAWVVRHFSVGRYWMTGERRDERFFQRVEEALRERGVTQQVAAAGMNLLSAGSCRLLVVYPSASDLQLRRPANVRATGTDLNNRSLVTRLDCGVQSVLFTADVETAGLSRLLETSPLLPVTVLKVPHHGARGSLNREWLHRMSPQYAVVSVGRHNSYGHPTPAVLEAYASEGIPLLRTDVDGAVWITGRLSSDAFSVRRAHDLLLMPTHLAVCLVDCERANWSRLWAQWNRD